MKFEVLQLNYPWVQVGVPIIEFYHFDRIAWVDDFMVNWLSDEVEDMAFVILGSNNPRFNVFSP